ncbi:MAG: tyrosine-type recombinase/integrase [Acidimicrobiia bacterium]|nr:tyrosine-type recombinase/integrase [Acidimicrobiia bacterium]
MRLDDLIDEFFLARMPKKHSEHTLAAYRRDLNSIRSQLSDVLGIPPEAITIDQLDVKTLRRAFAGTAHLAAATISRTWSTWNQLFGFLVAEQVLPGNPMAAVEKPHVPKGRPKAIVGDDSVDRLLRLAARGRSGARDPWPERDFAVVVTLLTCGLRLSELLGLTLRSLDGPEGDRVIGVRGKGNKERTVPLEPEVETILVDYLESRLRRFPGRVTAADPLFVNNRGEAMTRGSLQYLIEQLYREAGIRSSVPAGALVHALRHTFATSLARNGASGIELQRLLGHESLATTQRYVDATAREVRAAARTNEAYRTLRRLAEDG